jgi:uncharacterized membrane protein
MTRDDGGYDVKPTEPSASPPPPPANGPPSAPKPGEPGWVPPVPVIEKAEAEAEEPPPDPDIEKHKGMAVLAYILFLIPLVAAPNSKYARYHANQGLLLFILLICVCVIVAILHGGMLLAAYLLSAIPILDWFFACGLTLLQPALLVGWIALMIMGIINAANGLKKPLPGIGHWILIK